MFDIDDAHVPNQIRIDKAYLGQFPFSMLMLHNELAEENSC
jgi:hypothetical protein